MIGQTILQYQILERLGAGGMGEIYKAQDTRLNRIVAIKVLAGSSSGDPESRRRFIQEAQAASGLNHPNIVTIHDIITQDKDQFMVMEFVNGKTLGELIGASGLGVSTMLQYAIQITSGLQAAHNAGIVHRDLKPGNIMVTAQGHVKILDFGLAKVLMSSGAVSLSDVTQSIATSPMTVQGSILGTVSYMSPEQAQGAKVDARSDIFSLGCVLREMLTGCKTFNGDSALMVLTSILRDDPPPVCLEVPGVPTDVARAIQRALEKDPAKRWQSMEELQAELTSIRQHLDSCPSVTVATMPAVRARGMGKQWVAIAVVAGVVAACSLGGIWWWNSNRTAISPRTDTAVSQPTADQSTKPIAAGPTILTNDAIVEMVTSKVATSVIVSQIFSSPTNFNLSTPEIIRLTKAGVPEEVLQAMRNPRGGNPAAGGSTPGNPASGAATDPGAADAGATGTAQAARIVPVPGGVPFEMTLLDNLPVDCEAGQSIRFQVSKNVSFDDAVVVAKGSLVTGVIVESVKKKMLVHMTRPTFRLLTVTAIDGSRLKVRATAGRLGDSRKDPPLEPIGGSKIKDTVATAGSRFYAWFDGDQSITVRPTPPAAPPPQAK